MTHFYHPVALEAARLLGGQIRTARLQRRWSLNDFAERAGITKVTAIRIERGDPGVGLGLAFNAAVLAGVPLFFEDRARLTLETARAEEKLLLLPKLGRSTSPVNDDF